MFNLQDEEIKNKIRSLFERCLTERPYINVNDISEITPTIRWPKM